MNKLLIGAGLSIFPYVLKPKDNQLTVLAKVIHSSLGVGVQINPQNINGQAPVLYETFDPVELLADVIQITERERGLNIPGKIEIGYLQEL